MLRLACCFFKAAIAFYSVGAKLADAPRLPARISLNLVESRGQSARLSRIQPVFFFSKVNQGGVVLCRSRRLYKKRTPLKSWRSI